MTIRTVVLGMDFSEPAVRAARWTARHFANDAQLLVVHALDQRPTPGFLALAQKSAEQQGEGTRERAVERLEKLCATLEGERVRPIIRSGSPTAAIFGVVREEGADLVVVGEHGRRGGWDALGSTAERLLHTSPVPVLLARGELEARPRRLLVPVDEVEITPLILGWAASLAKRFDADISLLHVITALIPGRVRIVSGNGASREFEQKMRVAAEAWLERAASDAGLDPDRIGRAVAFGDPRWETLAAARRMDADLIVMGSRGAGVPGQLLLGSVARGVLRAADCPVLVVSENTSP